MPGSTLVRAPAPDPNKSVIENVLELTPLGTIGPLQAAGSLALTSLIYLCRELWHPPGARGVYGGAVIAQCLSAAQQTIPPPSASNDHAVFLIHSMHCYFVLAGDSTIPILYHVERVRDGKSFVTRTVQARQKGRCIFTTTLSFVKEGSAGEKTIDHAWELPADALAKLHEGTGEEKSYGDTDAEAYFVGTVVRVHNLWQFPAERRRRNSQDSSRKHERADMEEREPRNPVGIMVSLDHTIYFHRPREIKADEWLLSESEVPWAGDGRGLVLQRIWNKRGVLVASCVQEKRSWSFEWLKGRLALPAMGL
ncbi:MAG: hypothetical protein Q9212_004029 [Teloschistes hypoglaucus]